MRIWLFFLYLNCVAGCSKCDNILTPSALNKTKATEKPYSEEKYSSEKNTTKRNPNKDKYSIEYLSNHNTKLTEVDSQGRNIFHHILYQTPNLDKESDLDKKLDLNIIKFLLKKLEKEYPGKVAKMLHQQEKTPTKSTPFLYAIQSGDTELIDLVRKYGVPTEEEAKRALAYSIKTDNLNLLKYLVEQVFTEYNSLLLTTMTVTSGNANLTEYLLETGKIDINNINEKGNTALHHAIMGNGNSITLRLLLEKDSNSINTPNKLGETPLHMAINKQDYGSVNILLKFGADATLVDTTGATPLQMAEKKLDELKAENNNIPAIIRKIKKKLEANAE